MSHYTEVKTKIKDVSCLISALRLLGFKNVVHNPKGIKLRGYQGDERTQTAHVQIKGSAHGKNNEVGTASNDLGWEKMSDGTYRFHVSEFDVQQYGKDWQNKLMRTYAEEVVKKNFRFSGFTQAKREVKGKQVELLYRR